MRTLSPVKGARNNTGSHFILVGGSGFVGAAVTEVLRQSGFKVTIIDRRPPPRRLHGLGVTWLECDLLIDEVSLPEGEVVVLAGNGNPRTRWLWTLPLDIALATARLLPALEGRKVTLISSVEIYGAAEPPLKEDTEPRLPWSLPKVMEWCEEALGVARQSCAPWRVAPLCRRMSDADASGRWVYGLAKLAQEMLVRQVVPEGACTVLRLANTFGLGQERVVSRLVRRALANRPLVVTPEARRSFLAVQEVGRIITHDPGPGIFNVGGPPISIGDLAGLITELCNSSSQQVTVASPNLDSSGIVDASRLQTTGFQLRPLKESLADFVEGFRHADTPLFEPPLPIVIPPRPALPDQLADRQQNALWFGLLKNGNRWSGTLEEQLRQKLNLRDEDRLLLTTSGSDALRIAVAATAGRALPGQVALLPSFTYPATAEVLSQLGYMLRFVDVDQSSWTMDAQALESVIPDEQVRVVVCVDTFGNPCDYRALREVCSRAGVFLVADSAASIGSLYQGTPVATQADAHAYSMSFAKVLSSAGAGGAVVLGHRAARTGYFTWQPPALMDELHAAAALDQIVILDELVERRAAVAAVYGSAIEQLNGLTAQKVAPGNRHSYVHWVARVPGRTALASRLAQLGVETKEYFRALHLRPGTTAAPYPRGLPVTEALDSEALALPMSSELTQEQAEAVVAALEEALDYCCRLELPSISPVQHAFRR